MRFCTIHRHHHLIIDFSKENSLSANIVGAKNCNILNLSRACREGPSSYSCTLTHSLTSHRRTTCFCCTLTGWLMIMNVLLCKDHCYVKFSSLRYPLFSLVVGDYGFLCCFCLILLLFGLRKFRNKKKKSIEYFRHVLREKKRRRIISS